MGCFSRHTRLAAVALLSLAVLVIVASWPSGAAAHAAQPHPAAVTTGDVDRDHAPMTRDGCCHHDGTCVSKSVLTTPAASLPWQGGDMAFLVPDDVKLPSRPSAADPPPPRR